MHFCAANTVEPTPCRLIYAAKKRIYIRLCRNDAQGVIPARYEGFRL